MYYYKICGLMIESMYPLSGAFAVPAFDEHKRDLFIREGHIEDRLLAVYEEDLISLAEGFFFKTFHTPTKSWVRMIGHGCMIVQNGNEIIYRLKEGTNTMLIEETINCMCIGLIMIQRGQIMIHGSGVLWGDKAVIIGGESGSGKSTLTDSLLCEGAVFMADDYVAVDIEDGKIWAHPSVPQRKLCSDIVEKRGYDKSKLLLLPAEVGKNGVEKYAMRYIEDYSPERKLLGSLVVMQVRDDLKHGFIEKVTGSEKLKCITDNLYKYTAYIKLGLSREQFLECVQIANHIDVYRLVRPPTGLSVDEMVFMVTDSLNSHTHL